MSFREILLETESLKEIKNKYKDNLLKFNVYEFNDKISLDLIVVKEQNKGTGTNILKDLVAYGDSKNRIIILTPSSDFGGSVPKLIKFYKRFGFVVNDGKNKIFGIFEKMYRLPNGMKKEEYHTM